MNAIRAVAPTVGGLRCGPGWRVVVVDVETTGSGDGDRVVSGAAEPVSGGELRVTWSRLVDPGCRITRTKVHRLTEAHLSGQPSFDAIAEQFLEQLERSNPSERVVVAGRHVTYDVRVLRGELRGWEPTCRSCGCSTPER